MLELCPGDSLTFCLAAENVVLRSLIVVPPGQAGSSPDVEASGLEGEDWSAHMEQVLGMEQPEVIEEMIKEEGEIADTTEARERQVMAAMDGETETSEDSQLEKVKKEVKLRAWDKAVVTPVC